MEDIFKKLNLQERGLNVDGEKMTDLRFADDVALIASSLKDMEVQLNELNQGSKKIGLNIHKVKTKYMTNFKSDETIVIENDVIEKVDRYKYLGQTVMMENQTREEVMIRIKAGWSCFGRLKDILCDRKLPMSLRRRMFDQCVIPTMPYGTETWTTKQLEQKLITAQKQWKEECLTSQ